MDMQEKRDFELAIKVFGLLSIGSLERCNFPSILCKLLQQLPKNIFCFCFIALQNICGSQS